MSVDVSKINTLPMGRVVGSGVTEVGVTAKTITVTVMADVNNSIRPGLFKGAADGVKIMSIGFFVEEDAAVVWRGPMLHKALTQFLEDVEWGELDYLLLDLPPGTGDIALSLAQFLPRAELYVVTTPQPAAQRVAQRAAFMGEKVNLDVKGVIENMSWFTGDDGKRYELFGAGGGAELAERLHVPLLGQIPLVPELRAGGDEGSPIVVTHPDDEASVAFRAIETPRIPVIVSRASVGSIPTLFPGFNLPPKARLRSFHRAEPPNQLPLSSGFGQTAQSRSFSYPLSHAVSTAAAR